MRWVAALDKVAQAFATEIPLAQPDSDDNCVNYDRNIDEWIKTVVPEHVRIIRVVLKADNEHQKLLELVQSLQQIHQNLDTITRVFPGSQEVRRRQLKDLMLTLLSSLQEHQMDLEDAIPPGEASQLFALANFAAQSSYDNFTDSFSGYDSFNASVIGPAYNFLQTVPTTPTPVSLLLIMAMSMCWSVAGTPHQTALVYPLGWRQTSSPPLEKQIADANKEKEKSKTEVAGLRAQIQLLQESLENERAERKRKVEKEKEERKREVNNLREERKRMVNDLEVWKALTLKRDADLTERNAQLKVCIE
ncbi:hypothetical protein BN946_scf184980.g26 [Trametes cinnabarina]|uniref:Uncharacterized protein n=1 Tax=Pycnoporus cinnabarinus TaxID=5643 RepID=A0A060SDN5_PYCCI|nr:hypothetical protein BN946_scf184980.g26 [Trametes cinnabarina]